ncbi:hypothetical protein CRG98_030145, partial [Punica granatum]
SPPPTVASPPPSSSSNHLPNIHNDDDDSDSPPHPIDSPTSSSLSSGHSSISRLSLSSPTRDRALVAITPAERAPSKPPSPSPSPSPSSSPPAPAVPPVVVSVKRSVRDGPPPAAAVLEKVDQVAGDGPAVRQWGEEPPTTNVAGEVGGGGGGAVGGGGGRRPRPDLSILRRVRRESMVRRVQLVARVCGCLFCLVAFSVMAADKDQGWAVDSFYRYKEFRFCLAVNAIGFVYSGLQAYDLAYFSATGKHLTQNRLRPYLDFSLDQVLSYLLISATSSAATRVENWQMNWGKDKFPQMATASVAFTVLAFLSFALSSVISFYSLCTLRGS